MVGWHHWLNGRESEQTPGKPGVLQSIGPQRAGHDWVTEQQNEQQIVGHDWTTTKMFQNQELCFRAEHDRSLLFFYTFLDRRPCWCDLNSSIQRGIRMQGRRQGGRARLTLWGGWWRMVSVFPASVNFKPQLAVQSCHSSALNACRIQETKAFWIRMQNSTFINTPASVFQLRRSQAPQLFPLPLRPPPPTWWLRSAIIQSFRRNLFTALVEAVTLSRVSNPLSILRGAWLRLS